MATLVLAPRRAAATVSPVTAAELRTHARIRNPAEDPYLATLLAAATERVEDDCGLALLTSTWALELPEWPAARSIALERSPLASIVAVTYKDPAGATQTFSAANYTAVVTPRPGRLVLADTASWPVTLSPWGSAIVVFTAGFGSTSASVPAPLLHAVKLLAAWWYEQREAGIVFGAALPEVPHGVESIIRAYRVNC